MTNLDRPKVTQRDWQDVEIRSLTNLLLSGLGLDRKFSHTAIIQPYVIEQDVLQQVVKRILLQSYLALVLLHQLPAASQVSLHDRAAEDRGRLARHGLPGFLAWLLVDTLPQALVRLHLGHWNRETGVLRENLTRRQGDDGLRGGSDTDNVVGLYVFVSAVEIGRREFCLKTNTKTRRRFPLWRLLLRQGHGLIRFFFFFNFKLLK